MQDRTACFLFFWPFTAPDDEEDNAKRYRNQENGSECYNIVCSIVPVYKIRIPDKVIVVWVMQNQRNNTVDRGGEDSGKQQADSGLCESIAFQIADSEK